MIRHTLLINPLTRSLKCLFMANKGLNRFNHQPAVSMTTPPLVSPFTGQLPPQQQLQQQQAQAARDVNTASLCRIGQETVQDIVLRTMEIFQLLRNMQLPNGVTYHPNTHQDRLGKLQEHLRMLSVLFRKLRLVYDKCSENCAGLDPILPEQLIPFMDDDGTKHDDHSAGQNRPTAEDRREIQEVNKKLKQKNQQLKQIMDQVRNLIWEINSMLAVRS
ncbi:mediator of RNA polymerase II transcription subunit 30 isoform X2 [Phyllopteryx taeniolatus]|uniref:mediator of RNA polymerase II transcription subunit 30 isoform X2 n=1 Tax=Phyllopteryx taeniolatus TaxID=161469 RepID=UPI002AD2875E|nr:mediator of RNA polymerase II transcription subunit 30 isoform X2 [Phyllopteryx taeniolatus]